MLYKREQPRILRIHADETAQVESVLLGGAADVSPSFRIAGWDGATGHSRQDYICNGMSGLQSK